MTDPTAGDAGQRGRLEIDDRVVERVAAYAARQVDDATGAPRRVFGVNVGRPDESSDVRVHAHVDGTIATVDIAMTVQWPSSVALVTAETRRRVREEVRRITAVDVRQIDIEVVSMTGREQRPRVR